MVKAQPVRNCRGLVRDGLTMPFLEEGGYFDLPIKVAVVNDFAIEAAASPCSNCTTLRVHLPKI